MEGKPGACDTIPPPGRKLSRRYIWYLETDGVMWLAEHRDCVAFLKGLSFGTCKGLFWQRCLTFCCCVCAAGEGGGAWFVVLAFIFFIPDGRPCEMLLGV